MSSREIFLLIGNIEISTHVNGGASVISRNHGQRVDLTAEDLANLRDGLGFITGLQASTADLRAQLAGDAGR